MKKLVSGLMMLMVLGTASLALAGGPPPTGLPYQGRLTDNAGAPINGTRDLTLALYNSVGTLIYSETQAGVTVVNGFFKVEIGNGSPVSGSWSWSLFQTYDLYLGITVGGDPEMTPRIHFGYSPFAFTSRLADHAMDSPGISTRHLRTAPFPRVDFPASGTVDIIATTVNAPTAGYVFVIAGGQVNTSAAGYVSTWIAASAGSGQDNGDYGYTGVPSAAAYLHLERHKVFFVGAGSTTFYLAGAIASGAAGSYIWQPTITAIFVPASVGTIALAPPAMSIPDPSQGR
jgi:hypothetical protein